MPTPDKSTQQDLYQQALLTWPKLSKDKLIAIEHWLAGEMNNPEADAGFVSKRLSLVRKMIKRKR